MKRRLITIAVIICSIFGAVYYSYILPNIRDARASWIHSDYLYRTPITYTHNADITSPRRVNITINTSALISTGKMQSDCDDTRFANEAQKELRYQLISGCNTTTTSYDIEVLSVVNGTNTLHIYYGNNSAATESTDISGVTSLSPSGGSPSTGTEETALIPTLAYTMDEGYGTTTQDTTQQNRDGTISGALWRTEDLCVSGKCLYFDGTDDAVTTSGTTSNVRTVSFWVRPITTSEQLVDLNGSAYIQSSSGTISATGFTSPTIYVNGQVSSTLVANRWQHITVTTATGISASALRLGQISTNYGQMFMDEIQLYTTALTATQVQSLYNSRGSNLTSIQQGAYDQKALSDGLVGYWKMDEASWTNNCSTDSILDASGNNNNGDACPNSTGPTGGAIGKFGTAGNFDGVNDYINQETNLDPEFQADEPFTLSAWINPDTISSDGGIIGNTGGNNFAFAFSNNNANALMLCNNDGLCSTKAETNANAVTTGVWQHVVVNHDGNGNYQFYVNNTNVTSDSTGNDGDLAGVTLAFGRFGGGYFDGRIDEIRIYSRSLSSSEIAQLYNWAPGPVGYWKLDENTSTSAYDSSGNDNPLTLTNSPTWSNGKYGNSVVFEGSNQHLIRADDSDLDFADDASFTISTWFKHTTSSVQEVIVSKYQEAGYKLIIESDGDITCALDYDSTWTPTDAASSTAATYDDNQWHYISCVKTADTRLDLYIDGILIASDTSLSATNTLTNSDPLYIGIDDDGTSNDFTGTLDDLKIYNYARTPKQIIEDMNAGHPVVGTPIAGAVAHYKFDEGHGTTANDQTPNQNNLTLSTSSWTNDGKFGKAWDGDGSRWLSRADDPDFDFAASEDFTITTWFRRNTASSAEVILQKFESTGGDGGYRIQMESDGDISFGIDDDNASFPEDSVTSTLATYDDNQWHHLAAIKTSTSSLRLYIDGQEVGTPDTSISSTNTLENNDILYIADSNGTNGTDEFNGELDELKIYRAALTPAEILSDYNQGKTLVLGALSTESNGTTPSNSASREYCVPGDTSTCNAPVGEWKLDENTETTANDTGTAINNGTLTDGPNWSTGKNGSSLLFDGTNDHIDLGLIGIPNNIAAYTISAWIRPVTLGEYSIYCTASLASGCFYTGTSNELRLCNDINCINEASSQTSIITSNSWQYVAITYTGTPASSGQVAFYHNGRNVSSDSNVAESDGSGETFYISNISGNFPFNGKIDHVQVYNYVRTPAQIAWEFNRGAPIAWWKFDESSGTTAFDASQNGNGDSNGSTGTLNNSPTRLTTAKQNGGIDFDGTNDVVTITNNTRIDLNDALSQGLAFSAWIYPQSDGETDQGEYLNKGTSTYCGTINDDGTNVDLQCSLDLATSDATLTITDGLRLNQWNHVVMTWTNDADDEITIYINGKNRGSSTSGSGNTAADTNNLLIGGGTGNNFDGYIDEFKIFNYEPTQKQVELLYNNSAAVSW